MLPHIPLIRYGNTLEHALDFSIPQRPWVEAFEDDQHWNESATRVREVFTISTGDLLEVRLRFLESELPAVLAWLRWAQSSGASFRYFPDRANAGYHTCMLHSPKPGEAVRPERDAEYGAAHEIAVTLRRVDAGGFGGAYYG